MDVGIDTTHDDDRGRTVIGHSERRCSILQAIREDIPRGLDWKRVEFDSGGRLME